MPRRGIGIIMTPDAPRSREEAKEELEWHMHGHPKNPQLGLWATIHKESGKFIGRCGLLPWTIEDQYDVEVAYTIAEEYWGQGLGSEAAQAILLRQTRSSNPPGSADHSQVRLDL